jgi:hypothetical protein
MQQIKRQYRKDYQGEDIVTDRTYQHAEWDDVKEFIPNQIVNQQTSNRAVIIGNGTSRAEFDLNLLSRHTAGLRGIGRLQTYGCNALYRDYQPHFLFAIGTDIVDEIATSGYCDDHIVYANKWNVAEYPRKFYLIPEDPAWNSGSLATYMACFDGHQTVYLLGFDGNDNDGFNDNIYSGTTGYPTTDQSVTEDLWEKSMAMVFNTYPDVDFVRVAPTDNFRLPESWKYCVNLRTINFRQFALEVDL